MKIDDPADLATKDEAGASTTAKPASTKKREPTSEKLSNLSRVTPAQLASVVFPADGRFQPVRPVSVPLSSSTKKVKRLAGGGGILMLWDKTPSEPIEWIEPSSDVIRIIPVQSVEEADPPPPFEYPFSQEGK